MSTKCSVCLKEFDGELKLRMNAFNKLEPVCPICWKRRNRCYLVFFAAVLVFYFVIWLLAQNGIEWRRP